MQDSTYIIFIIFACIWILIGIGAVIALLKSEGEIRFGKWGLVVTLPIIIPFIFVLAYQILRPLFVQHFM